MAQRTTTTTYYECDNCELEVEQSGMMGGMPVGWIVLSDTRTPTPATLCSYGCAQAVIEERLAREARRVEAGDNGASGN